MLQHIRRLRSFTLSSNSVDIEKGIALREIFEKHRNGLGLIRRVIESIDEQQFIVQLRAVANREIQEKMRYTDVISRLALEQILTVNYLHLTANIYCQFKITELVPTMLPYPQKQKGNDANNNSETTA
jgi:hypothetical protein